MLIVLTHLSDDSSSIYYHRPRQCSGQVRDSYSKFSQLNLDAVLSLLVGIATRFAGATTNLRFTDAARTRHIRLEVLRVINAALTPLSEAIDDLTALEGVLEERRLLAVRKVRARRDQQ